MQLDCGGRMHQRPKAAQTQTTLSALLVMFFKPWNRSHVESASSGWNRRGSIKATNYFAQHCGSQEAVTWQPDDLFSLHESSLGNTNCSILGWHSSVGELVSRWCIRPETSLDQEVVSQTRGVKMDLPANCEVDQDR